MSGSKVEASTKQAVMHKYLGSSKINLPISKEQFEDLVGMVVHSGLPLFKPREYKELDVLLLYQLWLNVDCICVDFCYISI